MEISKTFRAKDFVVLDEATDFPPAVKIMLRKEREANGRPPHGVGLLPRDENGFIITEDIPQQT